MLCRALSLLSLPFLRRERGKPGGPEALALLLGLALLLARGGMQPARAQQQGGHVHHWTEGEAPGGPFWVRHANGQDVTDANPARCCEILRLVASPSGSDRDLCDAPDCPVPDRQASGAAYIDQLGYNGPVEIGHVDEEGYWRAAGEGEYDSVLGLYKLGTADRLARVKHGASGYFSIADKWEDVLTMSTGTETVTGFDDGPVWQQQTFRIADPQPGDPDFCPAIDQALIYDPSEGSSCMAGSAAATFSTLTPGTGDVSFSLPVTSWGYRGLTVPFGLTYHSVSLVDPLRQPRHPVHPACLSDGAFRLDYNPKWTHSFAQWIDVVGSGQAVWHRGDGTTMAFSQYWNTVNGQTTGPFWRSEESFHTLVSQGQTTSPAVRVGDAQQMVTVPFGLFTLTDGAGTRYKFAQVRWTTGNQPPLTKAFAVPYFLLTEVKDRWDRVLTINWDPDWGVTSVRDGDGRGLDFTYRPDHLLQSVTDPAGRVHQLGYTDYTSRPHPRLTFVTVQGAGSPLRAHYQWQFQYGGYYQDLITWKREPNGREVSYEYAAVTVPRASAADWSGRGTRMYYTDPSMGQYALREIVREGTELVYPGGDRYVYEYEGEHLVKLTHANTGASVQYRYDNFHNLAGIRTNVDTGDLVSLAYTYANPDARRITTCTATDLLGGTVQTSYNPQHLPTYINVAGPPGSSLGQAVLFAYDYGVNLPNRGNLLQVTTAFGTSLAETTSLAYGAPSRPDLPTQVTDSLGRVSLLSYHPSGQVFQSQGPPNLQAPVGSADRLPSTSTLEVNGDELPSRMLDPLGHVVEVTYSSPGGSLLEVSFRTPANGAVRTVTLDADGRPVRLVDPAGTVHTIAYNLSGQPTTAVAALGTANERVVHYYYNQFGQLAAFDPPKGAGSRVCLEYCQYERSQGNGAPVKTDPPVYLGQVTRVKFPDGTSEYFGYNATEEPEWRVGRDGGVTELHRDSLHRVYQVDYPQTPGYPAFSVSVTFDGLGRVVQSTDATGTATYSYDVRNRVTQVTPSVGRTVQYQYLPDVANQRWVTRVLQSGAPGSGFWEYREDGKGRTSQVVNPLAQVTTRCYDPDGKLVKEFKPNGATTEYGYNVLDQLTTIQHRLAGGSVVDTFSYSYDGLGRLWRELDGGSRAHLFYYNELSELVGEDHPDLGQGTTVYQYDLNGNRTLKTGPGGPTWYGYDAADKLLWANSGGSTVPTSNQAMPYRLYQYNANGEPTRLEHRDAGQGVNHDQYDWDGMGKLRRVLCVGSEQERYTAQYDGSGTRVSSILNGVNHVYSFGAGLLHDSAGDSLYTPEVSERRNGDDHFFHEDWLSSTRYLTDGTGQNVATAYRFDAWGNRSAGAGLDTTSATWAGGWGYQADVPMGFQLLGERYYDPEVGRFLSPDPIGFAGGINLYGYCANDPVGLADPSGRNPVVGFVVGGVIGGVAGGVVAYWHHEDVWAAAGKGALIGGISGATGAWVGAVMGGATSGVVGGIVTGAVSGMAGDAAGQLTGIVLCGGGPFNVGQMLTSGAIGGLTGGAAAGVNLGMRYFGRHGDLRPQELARLQAIADRYGEPVAVVGSGGSGMRRWVDLKWVPRGKKWYQRSDLDLAIPRHMQGGPMEDDLLRAFPLTEEEGILRYRPGLVRTKLISPR